MEEKAIRKADHQTLTIHDYEARIRLYKEQIGTGYIGIGRTLLEAKAAKVVPHGEWEQWVRDVAGLDITAAQRCMKAAREIRDGSALAQLEMSKALLLLQSGMDDEDREEIAKKAAEEGTTVRELRAEIEAYRAERAQMQRWNDQLKEAVRSKNAEITSAEKKLEKQKARNDELRAQLAAVKENQEEDNDPERMGPMTQALIDGLRDELSAAEEREARKSRELSELRAAQTRQALDNARGLNVSPLDGFDLAAAVRAFIGSAGVLPQMGVALLKASQAEREMIRANIETVARWVDGARSALNLTAVEGCSDAE